MNNDDFEEYKDVEVEFVSLYKGCFSYEGKHEGKPVYVDGGVMSYEYAYNLELNRKCKLSSLVLPEYWDIEITDEKICFTEKPDY